jgi:transcriptional regulator with XRE-family HTH domain
MTWKEIGQQVRAARQLKGWNARYLGRIVGLSTQSIISLEGGYGHRIPSGQLAAVLTLLGLRVTLG